MTQSISSLAEEPVAESPRRSPRWRSFPLASCLALVVVLALVTLYATQTQADYNIYLYNTFLLMCIGALAMNLLMGTTGLVSVGSAGFLAAGAYSAIYLERAGVPFVICVIGGGVAAAIVGLICSLPAIRLRGLALGLATISVHYVVVFIVDQYQQHTSGAGAIGFILPPVFGTIVGIQYKWAWLLFGVVAVVAVVVALLGTGRTGRALRLIRDQETIAPTQALPVTGYKMMIFAITSFMFGVEGALTGYVSGQVSSEQFTLTLAMQFLAIVIVGGLDSIWGAVIGAAIFVTLPYLTNHVVASVLGAQQASANGANYGVIVYAVIVVIFIVAAPRGLVGLFKDTGRKAWRRVRVPAPDRRAAGVPPGADG